MQCGEFTSRLLLAASVCNYGIPVCLLPRSKADQDRCPLLLTWKGSFFSLFHMLAWRPAEGGADRQHCCVHTSHLDVGFIVELCCHLPLSPRKDMIALTFQPKDQRTVSRSIASTAPVMLVRRNATSGRWNRAVGASLPLSGTSLIITWINDFTTAQCGNWRLQDLVSYGRLYRLAISDRSRLCC